MGAWFVPPVIVPLSIVILIFAYLFFAMRVAQSDALLIARVVLAACAAPSLRAAK